MASGGVVRACLIVLPTGCDKLALPSKTPIFLRARVRAPARCYPFIVVGLGAGLVVEWPVTKTRMIPRAHVRAHARKETALDRFSVCRLGTSRQSVTTMSAIAGKAEVLSEGLDFR